MTGVPQRLALTALALLLAACAGSSRPPQFIGGADLVYPAAAREAGVEGLVVVRFDVTAEGTVANAVVDSAEPQGLFEAAALAHVRSWRFRPAVENDAPVAAPNRVSQLRFRLGDTSRYARLPTPPAEP